MDDSYQRVLETLKAGLKSHEVKDQLGKNHPARRFMHVWSRLGVLPDEEGTLITLDNTRLMIPEAAQKRLITIAHVRPHAKSYFCKNLETGRTYLRSQDRIKLDPSFKPPNVEVKMVVLICPTVPLRGILKKPGSKSNIKKNVCFNASFHTARIIAKQSIKEWKESNKESM